MYELLHNRLDRLAAAAGAGLLKGGRKGIEKESLRVRADGGISVQPHPRALGSALTNQRITTDYSEALLEFVTPAFAEMWATMQSLCDIHQFTYQHLEDELLWATSMPCAVAGDESIPVARYGTSNVGRMKTVYRMGLGFRYGRVMQTISGVHFNYSLPDAFWPAFAEQEQNAGNLDDFRSATYFGLIRNVWRYGWLVLYLFGASPAICKSFMGGRPTKMRELDKHTFYEPYGTSLRMSDLGYQNKNQSRIDISVDDIDQYISDLDHAIRTPFPEYEDIGVLVDGEYRQLNANLLQIENEYYSLIRPKRVARSGERPTCALQRGGVEYVELRGLDVNAFDPVGVNQNELRFLEAFLIFCLLQKSPEITADEKREIDANHNLVARRGRDPELMLRRNGGNVSQREWARQLLDNVDAIAQLLDHEENERPYGASLQVQREVLEDPELTPSARILSDMRESGEPFLTYALRMSETHKAYFAELEAGNDVKLQELEEEARASLERQARIEASDEISFEEYLRRYFS